MSDPLRNEQKMYEKLASKSIKQQHVMIYIMYTIIGAMALFLLTSFIDHRGFPLWRITAIIAGAAAGCFVGRILIKNGKKTAGRLCELECSEGYSDSALDEAYRLMNVPATNDRKMTYSVIAAMMHNQRGEYRQTIGLLSKTDESIFRVSPSNAHVYYGTLMTAYLLTGNLDRASDTYNRGIYFMRTYMNNPSSGAFVSISLAIYEFYIGHYETSLQLLDNALRIIKEEADSASGKENTEQRKPYEQHATQIFYWKAVNLATLGSKAAAWEQINSCRNFYKTPYYENLCRELLDKMEKDEKQKQESQINETLS